MRTEPNGHPARRPGFALLAVLWVIVGLAALGLGASLAGREAVAAARNRVELTRAMWRAEECLERARAIIGEVLIGSSAYEGERAGWATLDRVVPTAPLVAYADCGVTVRPVGATLDLNAASEEMLRRLFAALRIPSWRSDSLVAALLDWRDADKDPRPFGAELEWYQARGLHSPRNGPFADLRELRRVRGFESLPGFGAVFGVEPGRIAVNHAPIEVLATLPGMTAVALARLEERRLRGAQVANLIDLMSGLPPAAKDSLMARFAELAQVATVEPDAWILTSRARMGTPAVTAVVEVRLVRAGSRAAIIRRRTWAQ